MIKENNIYTTSFDIDIIFKLALEEGDLINHLEKEGIIKLESGDVNKLNKEQYDKVCKNIILDLLLIPDTYTYGYKFFRFIQHEDGSYEPCDEEVKSCIKSMIKSVRDYNYVEALIFSGAIKNRIKELIINPKLN